MAKVPATRPELGQENKGPSRNLRPPPRAPVDQWDPVSRRDIQIRETSKRPLSFLRDPLKAPSSLPWVRLPPLCFPEWRNLARGCPPPPGATFLAPLLLSPETSPESVFNKSCLAPTLPGVVFISPEKTLHLVPRPGKEIEPPHSGEALSFPWLNRICLSERHFRSCGEFPRFRASFRKALP